MYDSFTSTSPSFWQGNIWKNILLSSHQAVTVEAFSYEDLSILIEFRSLWLRMIWAFSLGIDHTLYSQVFFEKAEEFVEKHGAIFWQREDYLDKNSLFPRQEKSVNGNESSHAYKHFLEPYTRVIDLRKDESVILGEMHEKWRYNIRLAEKRWVSTLWVKSTQENLDIWMNLLQDTTTRDRFSHNSRSYYENFLKNLTTENAGVLLFAYFEGHVIAGGIWSRDAQAHGSICYPVGSNSRREKARMYFLWFSLSSFSTWRWWWTSSVSHRLQRKIRMRDRAVG